VQRVSDYCDMFCDMRQEDFCIVGYKDESRGEIVETHDYTSASTGKSCSSVLSSILF
jgi:hypothetical protein